MVLCRRSILQYSRVHMHGGNNSNVLIKCDAHIKCKTIDYRKPDVSKFGQCSCYDRPPLHATANNRHVD